MMYLFVVMLGVLGIVACILGLIQVRELEKAQWKAQLLEWENRWLRQDNIYYLNILEEEYYNKMKGEV